MSLMSALPSEVRTALGDAASELANHDPYFNMRNPDDQESMAILWCVHEIIRLREQVASLQSAGVGEK